MKINLQNVVRFKIKQFKCTSKGLYNSNVGKIPPVLYMKYSTHLLKMPKSKQKVFFKSKLANHGIL